MNKLKVILFTAVSFVSASSFAAEGDAEGMDGIFGAVDLSSVTDFVTTAGIAIIGIALAFKGVTLAKRALGKA